jgi:hypothetical protein
VADQEQTFARLRANDVRLNLEKCIFRVPRGILLGFIVSEHGIEAKPVKITAITKMCSIRTSKGFSKSWVTSCHSVVSSCVLANEAFPFTSF